MSPISRLLLLLLCAAGLLFAASCAAEKGTPGELGRLTFFDRTWEPGAEIYKADQSLGRAVAVGARLDLGVGEGSELPSVERVELKPRGILKIELISNPVGLRALDDGAASVLVTVAGGTTDRISVDVAEPASALFTAYCRGQITVGYELKVSHATLERGLALTTGTGVRLWAKLLDEWGRGLTGHGAVSWTADHPEILVIRAASERPDLVSVEPAPGKTGETVLRTAGSGAIPLSVGPEHTAASLALVDELSQPVEGPVEVKVDTQRTFILTPTDAAGRLIIPTKAPEVALSAVSGEARIRANVYEPWCEVQREVRVRGAEPGPARLKVEALGLSTEVDLVVVGKE